MSTNTIGIWFVRIYNHDCPNLKKPNKCNYTNIMYRPKECCEEACPIKIHEKYDD